jgi:hypothetical protein
MQRAELMTENEFLSWVNRLDGYLSAVAHLNDRVGERHFFFANVLPVGVKDLSEFLIQNFNDEFIEISEIDNHRKSIRMFSEMVQRNIFKNFFLGASLPDLDKENFIKEQLKWHIEDYITMLETVSDQKPECWLVKHSPEFETESMVFKFGDFAFFVTFTHDTKATTQSVVK